jgi:hypothetical protein
MNLEKAVGCARVCCSQVHSVEAHEVKVIEAEKLRVQAVCGKFASGQLLFLGSMQREMAAHHNKERASRQLTPKNADRLHDSPF